jgi:hypothetical protein
MKGELRHAAGPLAALANRDCPVILKLGRRPASTDRPATVTLIAKTGGMLGSRVLRFCRRQRLRSAYPTPALGPKRGKSLRLGLPASHGVSARIERVSRHSPGHVA